WGLQVYGVQRNEAEKGEILGEGVNWNEVRRGVVELGGEVCKGGVEEVGKDLWVGIWGGEWRFEEEVVKGMVGEIVSRVYMVERLREEG
ncbi:hypothetical protein, partial [Paenibacillus xylanexedens]|uniref:hypothetical protein n=1 Tax=Paenibacillus xylanexedens TaxID=528191 RepID=UPI001C92C0B8